MEKRLVVKPIISSEMNSRCQIDLIDSPQWKSSVYFKPFNETLLVDSITCKNKQMHNIHIIICGVFYL